MSIEQVLYAQVVRIYRKDSENKKENLKTNKYNFQGKSAISSRSVVLDHNGLEESFMTHEPYFYKLFK